MGNIRSEVHKLETMIHPFLTKNGVRLLADLLDGRQRHPDTEVIVTIGRDELERARSEGLVERLEAAHDELMKFAGK